MAGPVGSLIVRVGSDISGLTSGLQKGARSIEDLGRKANKVAHRDFRKLQKELAESRKQVSGTSAAFSKFAKVAGPLIGVAFGVKAVRSIVSTVDAYTQLQNRLRAVTDSSEDLERIQSRLFDISRDTRSAVESNVELFSRLSLATKDLGTSEEEILHFTESLNQAIKLSGASAAEAQAGIMQLAQGMASGTLRGDELRSVLEQLPAVADVIAKSLGVTRGQLREMGTDGKITAEVILKAFREARGELADQFAETVPTVAESFVQLQNSLLKLGGAFSQATGLGDNLAAAIGNIAAKIDDLSSGPTARFLKDLPEILKAGAEGIGLLPERIIPEPTLPNLKPPVPSVIVPPEEEQERFRQFMERLESGGGFFAKASEGFRNLRKESTETFAAMSESAISFLSSVPEGIESLFTIGPPAETQKQLEERLEVIRQGLLDETEMKKEIEEQAFQEGMATLREGLEMKLLTEEEFRQRSEALEKQHQKNLNDLSKKFIDQRIGIVAGGLAGLLSSFASLAGDQFELQKALSIASATLSGLESIVHSYNFGTSLGGPKLGAVMAGIAAATTAAQIAQISSQEFKSGGGSAPPVVAGPPGGGPAPGPGGGGGGGGGASAQSVNISLVGESFGRSQVRDFIEQINSAVADGARLRIV